jgi:hypothetical protein
MWAAFHWLGHCDDDHLALQIASKARRTSTGRRESIHGVTLYLYVDVGGCLFVYKTVCKTVYNLNIFLSFQHAKILFDLWLYGFKIWL